MCDREKRSREFWESETNTQWGSAYLDQKAEVLLGSRQVFIAYMKAEFLAEL